MEEDSNSRCESPKETRVSLTPEAEELSKNFQRVEDHETSDNQETRSSSTERDKSKSDKEGSNISPNNSEDSFEYPESESARNKLISEALQKEDEFLEYLMSLPAAAAANKKTEPQKQLMRSTSTYASTSSSGGGPKVGLDHLDNLCKLMEQLGELREQNCKLQRRVQYLEDMKNLQEMHKQLQEEAKQREVPLKYGYRYRYSSINTGDKQSKRTNENGNHSGLPKVEFAEGSSGNKTDSYTKRNAKCKSIANSRTRQSLSQNQQRERSRSVGIDELKTDTEQATTSKSGGKHSQRRSVEGVTGKAKVSKWTKVKEAFRWEKAAVPDAHEDDRFLRVPPVSGDGDSSSAGSSGHSPVGEYSLALPLSSSSSSEDFDLDINFADILAELGPQRSASATDSTGGRLVQDARRLSLSNMPEEEDASRRSKSLDGDATIAGVLINRNFSSKDGKGKAHKTPWGKVKNIIQTRKDSLKKRHRKGDHSTTSDHEEDTEPPPLIDPSDGEATPEGKCQFECSRDGNKRHLCKTCLSGVDCKTSRRLTPMLTLTLPSSEELRSLPNASGKPPPSPQTEDRHHKTSTVSKSSSHSHSTAEDPPVLKADCCKRQTSNSAGTSPPVHRRATSKWTKVKKAFLTSAPGRREDDGSGRISSSVPSSPNRNSSFLYEVDADEMDSGDAEEGLPSDPSKVKAEIQRNYEELQQKLSLEFHKKLNEWEHMKTASSSAVPSLGGARSGGGVTDESYLHHDKGFRRKMEEWERMKSSHGQGNAVSRNRDSLALQPLEDLSPDFRKKLQEWEKMKKVLPTGRDEPPVPPHFKKRIAEWQLWRSKEPTTEEGQRRTQEWERMRSLSASSSADNADSGERSSGSGGKTPSPGVGRKATGSTRKGTPRTEGSCKGDPINSAAKTHHKGKIQKEKELQWLDKELQKIEREKQRLEREREKYLEREARLEKMRLAMGSGPRKQEVLIPTSTGLFRFQGISEKFTKRLYEWEKARGIRPEASTFALLDPGYKPPVGAGIKGTQDNGEGLGLSRSKSAGSVTNMSGGGTSSSTITHQPSSLSLNDVEVLGQVDSANMEETRATSEPRLHPSSSGDHEPAALIVDVEDVIVETAAPLAASPAIETQTPVYCYAPDEVTRLIDSSGSDSERDRDPQGQQVGRSDSVRTEQSYKLLDENMSLLNRLRHQEDICRKIESEIGDLETKIEDAAKVHEEELERLRREEKGIKDLNSESEERLQHNETVTRLRTRIRELERCQERLRKEGVSLQDSFAHHSEEQAVLAQNLVGNMKQLQQAQDAAVGQQATASAGLQQGAVALVHELSSELLALSEKLETALAERNREINSLRFELQDRRKEFSQSCGSLMDNAAESKSGLFPCLPLPRQSSEELSQIPSLLTSKVLELKQGLAFLCASADMPVVESRELSSVPFSDVKEEETSATFVVKMRGRGQRKSPEVVQVDSEGNTSPVTCVTIVPGFWQKKQQLLSDEAANRSSYCSSATSSVCEDDDDMELTEEPLTGEQYYDSDEVENFSDDDNNKDINLSQSTVRQAKREDSDGENSSDDTDHGDSGTDYSTGTTVISRGDREDDQIHSGENKSKEYYETEILPSTKSGVTTGRVKKLLKTRRVSDTHVGYTCKEEKRGSIELASKGNVTESDENSEDESNVRRSPKSKFAESRNSIKSKDGGRGKGNQASENAIVSTTYQLPNQATGKRLQYPDTVGDTPISPSEYGKSGAYSNSRDVPIVADSSDVSVPPHVFVKTTRKIFSPVRRDSKGKASSVISYVVGEPSPRYENESVQEQNVDKLKNTFSPVSNSPWRQRERGDSLTNENEGEEPVTCSFSATVPPAWMLRRSRSQSSSPAMTRKRDGSYTDESSNSSRKNTTDMSSESTDTSSTSQSDSKGSSRTQPKLIIKPNVRRGSSSEKSDKVEGPSPSACPTSPGFPPLPQSPRPERRELLKTSPKETAPSIRMMIAKYNLKLTEQEGGGGRSPEVGGSGSGSPVAWRSPVAERRVKAQMEKYQEEVRRVLQNGGSRTIPGRGVVQKSASAGVIRAPNTPTSSRAAEEKAQEGSKTESKSEKPPSSTLSKGILKSSSAGTIKPVSSLPLKSKEPTLSKMPENTSKISILPPPEPFKDSLPSTPRSEGKPPSPRLSVSPVISNPSSPEMGLKNNSPQMSRLRALKLKRAKEEFLTRGPGGHSWTSEGTPSSPTSSEAFEDVAGPSRARDDPSRLSQISVGSESSFDGSVVITNKDQLRSVDEGLLLVKSASAGMINVDPTTYRRFSAERGQNSDRDSLPRSVTAPSSGTTTPKSNQSSKFGISSIASKFRKVKMRRNKEKDSSKMNAVSTLCRQSLVVDIHRSGGDNSKQESGTSSKSCPSSPVLERPPPQFKPEEGASSWIRNPARKIFKQK
ncbi:serine-rich adhesin for platelets [Anabrus simplex]|uniref:serine-rich adhesin for platelets n=1 Tax=Anabrus simplex TaxID=316456 RepID=UPI0035A277E1